MSSDLPYITANLNFFDTRLSSSLNEFRWKADTPPSERPSNTTKPDTHPVRIYDLRRLNESEQGERGFRLGKCGFEIMQGWGGGGEGVAKAWDERKWEDQQWIENEYYSYIERYDSHLFYIGFQVLIIRARLVKDKLKATRTVAWDYTLRKPTYASSKSKDAPALVRYEYLHFNTLIQPRIANAYRPNILGIHRTHSSPLRHPSLSKNPQQLRPRSHLQRLATSYWTHLRSTSCLRRLPNPRQRKRFQRHFTRSSRL